MNKSRVAALIASGLSNSSVASIVGVTPARISQLMTEEDFKLLLAQQQLEADKKDVEEVALSAKYLTAEHALIDQIMTMAGTSEMNEAVSALKVISQRQLEIRKQAKAPVQSGTVTNHFVTLHLPNHIVNQPIIPTIQVTAQQEVIAVGDRNLAPLSSHSVTKLFQSMQAAKQGGYYDPGTTITLEDSSPKASLPQIAAEGSFLNSNVSFDSL